MSGSHNRINALLLLGRLHSCTHKVHRCGDGVFNDQPETRSESLITEGTLPKPWVGAVLLRWQGSISGRTMMVTLDAKPCCTGSKTLLRSGGVHSA